MADNEGVYISSDLITCKAFIKLNANANRLYLMLLYKRQQQKGRDVLLTRYEITNEMDIEIKQFKKSLLILSNRGFVDMLSDGEWVDEQNWIIGYRISKRHKILNQRNGPHWRSYCNVGYLNVKKKKCDSLEHNKRSARCVKYGLILSKANKNNFEACGPCRRSAQTKVNQ